MGDRAGRMGCGVYVEFWVCVEQWQACNAETGEIVLGGGGACSGRYRF